MFAVYAALLDALIRWYRDYRTRDWPTVEGEVQSCQAAYSRAVVTYTYNVDNVRLTGIHERSCYGSSVEEYARLFAPKWGLVVRYNGASPEESFVVDEDQTPPPAWATRYNGVED